MSEKGKWSNQIMKQFEMTKPKQKSCYLVELDKPNFSAVLSTFLTSDMSRFMEH